MQSIHLPRNLHWTVFQKRQRHSAMSLTDGWLCGVDCLPSRYLLSRVRKNGCRDCRCFRQQADPVHPADYNLTKASDEKLEAAKKTFSDVYEEFYQWKYERDQSRKLSESSKNATRAAYKNCSDIHDKVFADLRHQDLQNIIDSCPLKHASKELIVSLMHQM